MTALAGGNFLVTYTDFAADPGGDIRARLYAPNGTALGSDFAIDAHNLFDDTQSSVSALSGGGFVVTYTRGFGGNIGIRARVFDQNGRPSNQPRSSSTPGSGQTASSVAGLSSGGFVAVWQDDSTNEVYFRRFQSDGTPLDAGRVLIDSAGTINEDIHVVALADGGFAVAYTDSGWGIDGTEITFRIFNADGTTRTDYIRANDVDFGGIEAGDQHRPTITTMGDLIVVGWLDVDGSNSHGPGVRRAGQCGSAINSFFAGQVLEHELSGLANGHVANVWQSSISEDVGFGDSIRTNGGAVHAHTER